MDHLFEFTLKPIEECVLQGSDTKNIWWFWITDSWYTIHLGETRLFESSPAWRERYPGNPDMDYYYIRWLEDFFDILPDIAVDIPEDMYRLIDDEEKREQTGNQLIDFWEKYEDEEENVPEEIEDIYNEAMKLIYHGILDTGFLRYRSVCRFCRQGDELIIHYDFRDQDEDGILVWSAGVGQYRMKYDYFLNEVQTMLDRFFEAMDRQIWDAVNAARENPGKYEISGRKATTDPDEILYRLQKEQEERRETFYKILESVKTKNELPESYWKNVRQALVKSGLL